MDREAAEREAQCDKLRAEINDNFNVVMKTLEDGQNDLAERIEEDLKNMKESNDIATENLQANLVKLKKNIDDKFADQDNKLDQEIKRHIYHL